MVILTRNGIIFFSILHRAKGQPKLKTNIISTYVKISIEHDGMNYFINDHLNQIKNQRLLGACNRSPAIQLPILS